MNEQKRHHYIETVRAIRRTMSKVIQGKDRVIDYMLVALLGNGHILLEDVPGVGKTTLAKSLAGALDLSFSRIQFTPDLLPTDIVGGSIYNPQSGSFDFRAGPVFANVILADEINRASPRTQSALLESMTEFQVTVEGTCHRLSRPFVVIATQNPIEFHGTFPLPESQLDRFFIRISVGYPDEDIELRILNATKQYEGADAVSATADGAMITEIQSAVREIGVEDSVSRYLLRIVRSTRESNEILLGASPRAAQMLFRASQALAFMRERDAVVPDDVKELAFPVLSHRLVLNKTGNISDVDRETIVKELVDAVPVPV